MIEVFRDYAFGGWPGGRIVRPLTNELAQVCACSENERLSKSERVKETAVPNTAHEQANASQSEGGQSPQSFRSKDFSEITLAELALIWHWNICT